MESEKITTGGCKYLQVKWVQSMTETLTRMHPEYTKDQIQDLVIKTYQKRFTDHPMQLYNSYENTVSHMTLGVMIDWIEKFHPLIAESGVLFYPKNLKRNVNIEIIKECMLDARTIHKAEKFKAMEAGDSFTASVKDIQQGNDKKAANSGYGAEGQSSSFLFNVHSAMSVTASGRGQLSTAILCYENFFGDFAKFFTMNEFHTFMHHVVHEQPDWKFDTFEIIPAVPSEKTWVKRFESKFLHKTLYNHEQIVATYNGLSDEERIRTYYKCNLRMFLLDSRRAANLLDTLVNGPEEFVDPNKVPESMKKSMNEFTALVTEFVNYRYSWFRYEDRARYQRRSVVIVSDTDSTFLSYGPMLRFIRSKVIPGKLFRKGQSDKNYKIKILNTLSCCASAAIATTLNNYLGYVHVAPEDRGYIKMKNEFYYERVIVTFAKKSYIGLLTRQESVILKKPKIDVKGVNFFKSTSTENTSQFIYNDVLMDQLLRPKHGDVSLLRTYRTITDFRYRIADQIRHGDMGFLKRSIKVKSQDAYLNPLRVNQFKATYVWNQIVPEKDQITLPATVTLVKVKLAKKNDAAALAPWPDIYRKVLDLFEKDPYFSEHEEVDDKGKKHMVKAPGISAIALPGDLDEVPDWVVAIIDTETLVADNMKLFTQLYRPLGLSPGKTKGSNVEYYTNIIRI